MQAWEVPPSVYSCAKELLIPEPPGGLICGVCFRGFSEEAEISKGLCGTPAMQSERINGKLELEGFFSLFCAYYLKEGKEIRVGHAQCLQILLPHYN